MKNRKVKYLTEDGKVKVYLMVEHESALDRIVRIALELFYSFTAAYFIGRLLIQAAYEERGYKAYGGEYLMIIVIFFGSLKLIHTFFKNYRR